MFVLLLYPSYAAKKYLKRDKTFKTRKLSLMSEKFMRQNFRCKSALLGGRRSILSAKWTKDNMFHFIVL